MRTRRGYSLIELLIVLSVGTVMVTIAVSMLYMLKEAQVKARRDLDEARTMARLAGQFRDDVHAAIAIEHISDAVPPEDGESWQLTVVSGTTVRYRIRDGEIQRASLTNDGEVVDDFRLPRGIRATLDPPGSDSPIAALRFVVADSAATQVRPVPVEAVLGFANRHADPADRTVP